MKIYLILLMKSFFCDFLEFLNGSEINFVWLEKNCCEFGRDMMYQEFKCLVQCQKVITMMKLLMIFSPGAKISSSEIIYAEGEKIKNATLEIRLIWCFFSGKKCKSTSLLLCPNWGFCQPDFKKVYNICINKIQKIVWSYVLYLLNCFSYECLNFRGFFIIHIRKEIFLYY